MTCILKNKNKNLKFRRCVELDVVARLACDRATLSMPLSTNVLRSIIVGILAIQESPTSSIVVVGSGSSGSSGSGAKNPVKKQQRALSLSGGSGSWVKNDKRKTMI